MRQFLAHRSKRYPTHQQAGFSLLEVLIAVVILSIGLLGVAALQAQSMRYNHQAYLRGQAVQLAYDMSDRMRANDSMIDSNGDTTSTASGVRTGAYDSSDASGNSVAAANNSCAEIFGTAAADCNVLQLAADDLFNWNATLAAALPNGLGTVCLDSTPATVACDGSGNHQIKVSWSELQGGVANIVRFELEYQ